MQLFDVHLRGEFKVKVYNLEEYVTVRSAWFVPVQWRGKATEQSAILWAAKNYDRHWNGVSRKYEARNIKYGELIPNVPNTPMKLRIVKFESRGNGGLAYKVVSEEGYYFDMRQPEFLNAAMNGEIKEGGYLDGEYMLEIKGSQVRTIKYEGGISASN